MLCAGFSLSCVQSLVCVICRLGAQDCKNITFFQQHQMGPLYLSAPKGAPRGGSGSFWADTSGSRRPPVRSQAPLGSFRKPPWGAEGPRGFKPGVPGGPRELLDGAPEVLVVFMGVLGAARGVAGSPWGVLGAWGVWASAFYMCICMCIRICI